MKKSMWLVLLLFGAVGLTCLMGCSKDKDDPIDTLNPQVGTWVAEETDQYSSQGYEETVRQTIEMTKSGAFSSDERTYITCTSQAGVNYCKSHFNVTLQLNRSTEITSERVTFKGYYTWDLTKSQVTVTKEGTAYSSGSYNSFILTLAFTPDYSSTRITYKSGGTFSYLGVFYSRQ